MKQMLLSLIAFVALSCGDPAVEKYDPVPGDGGTVQVTPTPQPAKDHWAALADSCTNVLVTNFLDKSTGTFWSTPNDIEHSTTYIYWQQAHALDVLLYCVERVKESVPNRAALYLDYADKWYKNYANNYNRTYRGEGEYGGFFNDYTDDMAWICLTLIRMTEVSEQYSAFKEEKTVFFRYSLLYFSNTSFNDKFSPIISFNLFSKSGFVFLASLSTI